MTTKRKIAFALYLIAVILSAVFASLYLFRSEFMPYHSVAVSMTWEEVSNPFQVLTLALMRVSGGGWLAATISMAFLLFIPFRKGERWANWAFALVGLSSAVPTLIATFMVKFGSPANPPWVAAAGAIVILLIGFVLGLKDKTNE